MWLSTKRKSTGGASSSGEWLSTTSGALHSEDWQSSLPLDWTRLKRRRPGFNNTESSDNRRSDRTRPLPMKDNNDDDKEETCHKIEGQAIFCLHDDNPNWIQGYFIAKGSRKPWGMLATQEEVDDCMTCCAGGYRRLSLAVYHRHRGDGGDGNTVPRKSQRLESSLQGTSNQNITNKNDVNQMRNEPWNIVGIDWTGGDMMTLHHPDHVDMKGERLLTGKKALPMLHKYFQNMINRLEKEFCVEECSSVLDWLPNVAIVTGPMSLTRPKR